jgi:hypothetical protein
MRGEARRASARAAAETQLSELKEATSTLPIVMASADDAVGAGEDDFIPAIAGEVVKGSHSLTIGIAYEAIEVRSKNPFGIQCPLCFGM